MDDVPRDIRAVDFADQARSLTARGGAFYHYAQAMGNVSDSSGHRNRLRGQHLDCYPLWVNPDLTIHLEHWEHPLPPHISAAAAAFSEGLLEKHASASATTLPASSMSSNSSESSTAASASAGEAPAGGAPSVAALHWEVAPDKVSDELLAIAEPKSRPDLIHTYALTTESLHGE
jgi:hypothetical protein